MHISNEIQSDQELKTKLQRILQEDSKLHSKTLSLNNNAPASQTKVIKQLSQTPLKDSSKDTKSPLSKTEMQEIRLIMDLLNGKTQTSKIHQAVIKNDYERIDLFIRLGEDLNVEDKWGLTPLDYSTMLKNPISTAKLLANNAKHGSRKLPQN